MLPKSYQEVEYLESTGTQYIDTGITASTPSADYLYMKMACTDYSGLMFYFGTQSELYINAYFQFLYRAGTGQEDALRADYAAYNNGTKNIFVGKPPINTPFTVEIKDGSTIANGVAIQMGNADFGEHELYLFCRYPENTGYYGIARIYQFTYEKNNSDSINLVPCYRISDNKPGMYDTVRDLFLTNQGTGEFLVGPDVLYPREFQRVEYLESTGTQWLDTGYVNTDDTWAECEYMITSISIGAGCVFGSGIGVNSEPYGFLFAPDVISEKYSRLRASCGTAAYVNVNGSSPGKGGGSVRQKHQMTLTSEKIKFQGTYEYSPSGTRTTSAFGKTMYIFACHNPNTDAVNFSAADLRIYSLTFYENDEAKVNLIPVYRKYDEKPGMYDTVRGVFLTNQGEGEFVTGPPVYPSMYRQTHPYEMAWRRRALVSKARTIPDEYEELEYIETNGYQYITTDVMCYDHNSDVISATFALTSGTSNTDIAISGGHRGTWGLALGSGTRRSPYTDKPASAWVGYMNVNLEWVPVDTFIDMELDATSRTATADDVTAVIEDGRRHLDTPNQYTLFQFAVSSDGGTAYMRLKRAEIVGKGYFQPCIHKQDGIIGVFNTVTGKFLANAGRGTFGYEKKDGTYVAPKAP